MADATPVENGAWRVATAFAAQSVSASSHNFFAVYTGESFASPERGVIGVMARAHAEGRISLPGARDAAQLAVHSFAEGYFGAQRTLSARRAASQALVSLNRWLAAQMHGDTTRHLAPVSLSALLLERRHIGMVQIGVCQLYRLRGKALSPLMRPHARLGEFLPARALGLNDEFTVDHAEELAEEGDVYLLIGGVEGVAPELVYGALLPRMAVAPGDDTVLAYAVLSALAPLPGIDKSVMVMRIAAAPADNGDTAMASLANLPLRPPPREGDVWDNFTIGQTLFRGRYTILKAAYDTIGQREVAMKIPLPSMLQDEVFAAGFMREAWIGTAVRGSNVVRYLDLPPERRSSLYLVMPLYRGESLEKRLNRPPLIGLPEGVGIALKLCEAVQDLAAIQIIHRDIKPENVMLLDERGEVRLLDLGLAYLPGIDTTEAVKPGGTIRYMAPELLHNVPASARTEVYALGVTIYRMFSGGPFPFGQREKLPLGRMRPDLPRWLGLVLQRALAPKPEDRYADAGELARALQTGLVQGGERVNQPLAQLRASELYVWRVLTALFATGFLYLLLHGH
ncbi:MAG TPA: serine/threonine-protein kinase [Acidocella sp.]|nr:serine/threonine-protein kinase [Acidocella sp.]